MDIILSIQLGTTVKTAEAVPPSNQTNQAGTAVPISYGTASVGYNVVGTIYGNDLATDLNPQRGNSRVSFGLILQAANGDVVVSIRGTDGIMEWIHDALFLTVACPFPGGAGATEDGFTAIYKSLTADVNGVQTPLTDAMTKLPFAQPVGQLTVCGHSLGGALATLLAFDLAVNTPFKSPVVYTYASPRTGDPDFAAAYGQAVPNTTRIANRVDLVPKLPLPPLYEHVGALYDLSAVIFFPPKILVKPELACEHHMTTYLHLLSQKSGGPLLSLDAPCAV